MWCILRFPPAVSVQANAAYEHLALALLTMYGYDLGLDYSKIYSLSKLLRSFIDLPVRGNMGVIGDRVFDIESGIVAGWYKNVKNTNPLLVTPYLPELTGHPEQRWCSESTAAVPLSIAGRTGCISNWIKNKKAICSAK